MRRIFLGVVVAFIFAFLVSNSQAAVWEAQNSWSQEWEEKYASWVKDNWDENFFVKKNTPFNGLKLDCADAVYSMRVIFSFLHSLPFAAKDPTSGSKKITNAMKRWDDISDPEKRIRLFLKYIYPILSTSTLPDDTFPVEVDKKTIRSGALLLTDHKNHHSWTIKEITPEGVPHLIYSSRPAKSQIKQRIGFPSMGFVFPKGLKPSRHAGFRNFRQPEHVGLPVWEVPGYSLEQYSLPYAKWRRIVQQKLATREESYDQQLQRLFTDACQNAQERVTAVNEGLEYIAGLSRCLDSKEYGDFSTPNRDQRLRDSFVDLFEAIQDAKDVGAQLSPELGPLISALSSPGGLENTPYSETCRIEIRPGEYMSFSELANRSLSNRLSNNPHDPSEYRWGEKKGRSVRARRCPVYD